MKPKVLITQKIFDEAIETIKQHFDVEENQSDFALSPQLLKQKSRTKWV